MSGRTHAVVVWLGTHVKAVVRMVCARMLRMQEGWKIDDGSCTGEMAASGRVSRKPICHTAATATAKWSDIPELNGHTTIRRLCFIHGGGPRFP